MLHSRASIVALSDDDFIDQKILAYNETCSFDEEDIGFLKSNEAFPVGIVELVHVYDLSTFRDSRFLPKLKPKKSPLFQKSKHNDSIWKEKYFCEAQHYS